MTEEKYGITFKIIRFITDLDFWYAFLCTKIKHRMFMNRVKGASPDDPIMQELWLYRHRLRNVTPEDNYYGNILKEYFAKRLVEVEALINES